MTQSDRRGDHAGRSGVDPAAFTSRRNLLARRFIRNTPAVVALVLLVLLFVGCYALPPLLPYGYTDLDFDALLQPPSAQALVRHQCARARTCWPGPCAACRSRC